MMRFSPIDPNAESIGRRNFLGKVAVASPFVSSLLTIGCGSETPTNPYVPPDTTAPPTPKPVIAEISGDTELQLPGLGEIATGNYSSSDSTGPITSRVWTAKKDVDPFDERRVEDLGDQVNAQANFLRPGTYTVEVEVKGESVPNSKKTMQTTVAAPELPGEDYPLIVFSSHAEEGVRPSLYLADPRRVSQAHRLAGISRLNAQALTWERTGERFATDFGGSSFSVGVYNLLTDELVTIRRGSMLWEPSWNPRKDWIAAIEMGRTGRSEPVLIRPDGSSEHIYLAGDTPREEVAGSYPTWDPEGERLMLANANFRGLSDIEGRADKRAAIYEGFWDGGTPTRTQMPTEEQIRAFLDARGDINSDNLRSIRVGMGGISISPSGEEAVFRFEYGYESNSKRMIAKSRLDGTGDIEMLVPHTQLDSLFSPIWSPNGNYVLFGASTPGDYKMRIYKMSANGGSPSAITNSNLNTSTVAWYQ